MGSSTLTEKDWLDYLNRLNDRLSNQSKISGFTSWAISGLLILICNNILDYFRGYSFSHTRFGLLMLIVATTINVINFAFIGYIFSQFSPIDKDDIRIESRLRKTSSIVILLIFLSIIIISLALNIFVIFKTNYTIKLPYCIALVIYFLGGTSIIVTKLKQKLICKKLQLNHIPQLTLPGNYSKHGGGYVVIWGIFSSVMLLVSCLPYKDAYELLGTNTFISSLKISVMICSVPYALLLLARNNITSMRQQWLEKLERRILIEHMESEEIRKSFVEEYIGDTGSDWLKNKFNKISIYFSEVENSYLIVMEKMSEAEQENLPCTTEMTSKICELTELYLKAFEIFQIESLKFIAEQNDLIKQGLSYIVDEQQYKLLRDDYNLKLEKATQMQNQIVNKRKIIFKDLATV